MNAKAKECVPGIIAAATYGVNPLFVLPSCKADMNPDPVLFFRYLFAISVSDIMIKARGRGFKLKPNETVPLILIGLLVSFSSLTLFQSYSYMEAGIASILLFVCPILAALVMVFVFREKLTLQTIFCILLALGGIDLLYRSNSGATLGLTGVLLVMTSALSYAIYIVSANHPLLKNIATLKLTFYVSLFGMTLFLIRIDFGRSLRIVHDWYLWGSLIALTIFPTAVPFLYTTLAVQYISSTPTAILGALEPLIVVLFGVTVFGESLILRSCYGIILIILAVILIIAGGNATSHLVHFRKFFPRLPLRKKSTGS